MVEMAGIKFALSALNFDVLVCFLFHFVKSGKRFTPNFCSLLPGTGVNYYSGTWGREEGGLAEKDFTN